MTSPPTAAPSPKDSVETCDNHPISAEFDRISAQLLALGDVDDDETNARRGELLIEAALYNGYLALLTMPGASNHIVSGLRIDGAEDPMHAAVSLEVRWRAGQLPSEQITELKAQAERLYGEWVEMKRERDDARREMEQLRERVPISVAEIEQSGVTIWQLVVWSAANGVNLAPSFRGAIRPVLLIDSLAAWSAAMGRSPRQILAEIAAGPRQ